jgi:cellulose biosynthesis protein BcsQ
VLASPSREPSKDTDLPPTFDRAAEIVLRTHRVEEAVAVLQAKNWKFSESTMQPRVLVVAAQMSERGGSRVPAGSQVAGPAHPVLPPSPRVPRFSRPAPEPWEGIDLAVLPDDLRELVRSDAAYLVPTTAAVRPPKPRPESLTSSGIASDVVQALAIERAAARARVHDTRSAAERGRVIGRTERGCTVSYELEHELAVEDGAKVTVEGDGGTFDAEVISRHGATVRLWIQTDKPPVPAARITADASYLLALRQQFLADPERRTDLERTLQWLHEPRERIQAAAVDSRNLTADQARFVGEGLANDVTWLWGPPGTGKTTALAHLLDALSRRGDRVLFVANTNAAVDTALVRYAGVCELYALGEVVRVGPASLREVDELPVPVTLDQIQARQGERIAKSLVECKKEITHLRELNLSRLNLIDEGHRAAELSDADDLSVARERDAHFDASASTAPRVGFLVDRRSALEELLRRLQARAVASASLVFATAHRCYLRDLAGSRFDYVVVDEASMLSTDLTLIAAAMSDGGVVVAGDFRQLGPICLADAPLATRWLRRSIFEETGITDEVGEGRLRPGLVALQEQHRMKPPIERLVADVFYPEIALRGAPHVAARPPHHMPILPDASMVLVDTSALRPWMAKRAGWWSRYNACTPSWWQSSSGPSARTALWAW